MENDGQTDEELMAALAASDKSALGELMRRHSESLLRYAVRLSGSVSLAEDLCQDTWLTTWQQAGSYQPEKARVTTWLFRILHNRYVDTSRKTRRLSLFGLKAPEAEVTASDTHADDRANLDHWMRSLPPNQRAALLLKYASGLSNSEVAQILGVSVRAVESLQSRAKRALRGMRERQSSAIDSGNAA